MAMSRRWGARAVWITVATLLTVGLGGWWFVLRGHSPAPDDRAAVPPAASAPCIPTGQLTSVAAINRFMATSPGNEAFRGGDVGVDVGLHDGRRLWFFADTLRSSDAGGPYLVRNSALLFSRGCIEVVPAPAGGPLVPDRADGVGYGPMSALRVTAPGSDTVYVMVQRVRTVTAGLFGFAILGPSVAVLDVPWGGTPRLVGVHDLGPDRVDRQRPVWGAALAVSRGWVHLYGTSMRRLGGIHGFALSVARTRPAHLLDVERWRFWNGERWARRASEATRVIDERGGVSETLSVFEQGGRWFAVSKRGEFLGDDLVVWTAPSPAGPFDAGTAVAPLPCPSTTQLTYLPLAHPELLPRPGTVVVSWSRNSTEFDDVCADPASYRPQFRRVPLPR